MKEILGFEVRGLKTKRSLLKYIEERQKGRVITQNGKVIWAPVAHACNPSYSGGREQEDLDLRSDKGKQFVRPYLEKKQHKIGLGVAQIEPLPSKCEALSSRSSAVKTKKNVKIYIETQPQRGTVCERVGVLKVSGEAKELRVRILRL
jgi:hypothetical protein